MSNLFFTLILGFILGIKHAFEPDHVIAVSTIVNENKEPFKAIIMGIVWGLGHTTILLAVGILVLVLRISVPQNLSLIFELIVGIMLIFLGFRAVIGGNLRIHIHKHKHENLIHEHLHEVEKSKHSHRIPFTIGLVHGLAGSGALMLLVLSSITSLIEGIFYILIFGFGSILSMGLISLLITFPLIHFANKFPRIELYFRVAAGALSIIFGLVTIQTVLKLI